MKDSILPVDRDVVIVGAGPAGSMLAWQMARLDASIDVLMVDSRWNDGYSSYHDKCAGCISKGALDLILPHARVSREVKKVIEHWCSAPVHEFSSRGYIIDRPATFRSMIGEFTGRGGHFTVDTFLSASSDGSVVTVNFISGEIVRCNLLVGADGANSSVRRACKFGVPNFMTIVQAVVPASVDDDAVEMWYDERYSGLYKYRFPSAGASAKVGFVHGTDHFEDHERIQSRQVAWGGLDTYYRDGVVLIGDAAGQCNPVTCGGIRTAFIAGRKLASVLARRKKKNGSLRRGAESFSRWWKRSPYESRKFGKAYESLKQMKNAELEDFSTPFRARNVMVAMFGILKRARYWSLYRMFIKTYDEW